MKRIFVGFIGVMLSVSAIAAGNRHVVRKTVEASMQVTGQVVIAADRTLMSYTIDKQETLPPEVQRLLARYLPSCQFEVRTASGKPEPVKANMTLQLVARQTEDGGVVISVNGSVFEDPDTPQYIVSKSLSPPKYPMNAVYSGMSGTVYVVLRLHPDGTVAQAHAERVDMTVVGSENQLRRGRDMLAEAALLKARQWTFEVKPQRLAEPGSINVRVPVAFNLSNVRDKRGYGEWDSYVPGPHVRAPWLPERIANDDVGAMTPGRLYLLDSAIKLRNPPAGS